MSIRDFICSCEYPTTGGKIAWIAEAPGQTEMDKGRPLVGASGQEWERMLREAGCIRSEGLVANVFDFKLPGNKVKMISGKKKDMPKDYPCGPVEQGAYVYPEYLDCLERLRDEIINVAPNVIVPMGNTALWAVCGVTGITKYRGYIMESTLCPGIKVLPTFHPAAILRAWHNRILVIADMIKARLQSEYPEVRRPNRELWLYPTVEDLVAFEEKYLMSPGLLGVDIETARPKQGRFITCIGFAPTPDKGIVIPFVDRGKSTRSYWIKMEDEIFAWKWVRRFLESRGWAKLFQYGMYDMIWFLRESLNIRVMNAKEDTMILHHTLQPEMLKSLHFLGSAYTEEMAWKLHRPKGMKTEKREDN